MGVTVKDQAKVVVGELVLKPELFYEVLLAVRSYKVLSTWFPAMVGTGELGDQSLEERWVRMNTKSNVVVSIQAVTGSRDLFYAWYHSPRKADRINNPSGGVAWHHLQDAQDAADKWLQDSGYLLA